MGKMKKLKLLFLTSLTFGSLFLSLIPISALAQTFSLGIYPPLLEVMIQPGKFITQVYKVKNSGDDIVLVPNVVSFEPKDELGNIYLTRLHPVSKDWFSLINAYRSLGQAFSLPSGRTDELVLKVKIPQNVEERDYYFSLILTTSPTPPIGQTKTGMKAVLASNILLTISKDGNPRKLAEIVEFSLENPFFSNIFDSFNKPRFVIRLRNIGQSYFKPQGSISIYNTLGQLSETLELLPENVLVNSIRTINCRVADRATPCQLKTKLLIGRYKAKLNFKANGKNYQAEAVFWALPIKLALALLTIFVLLSMMKSKLKLGLDK